MMVGRAAAVGGSRWTSARPALPLGNTRIPTADFKKDGRYRTATGVAAEDVGMGNHGRLWSLQGIVVRVGLAQARAPYDTSTRRGPKRRVMRVCRGLGRTLALMSTSEERRRQVGTMQLWLRKTERISRYSTLKMVPSKRYLTRAVFGAPPLPCRRRPCLLPLLLPLPLPRLLLQPRGRGPTGGGRGGGGGIGIRVHARRWKV